jgi:tRNA pseudouridine32 synthase / 23S rRNA pseudouridine746 synthase
MRSMHPIAVPGTLPERFPSPFDRAALHPLAQQAARDTMAALDATPDLARLLAQADGGKMFGVLVVQAPNGAVGYLRGFSGMLAGQWQHDGWVPPAFARSEYDKVWRNAEPEMRAPPLAFAARSRELLREFQATYHFANASGTIRSLRELFAPAEPPGGSGDCAGPKLLAEAYRTALRPLAMAEFWWGAPPRSGDRRAGSFYPACRGKCAPILAHMLHGLPADPAPVFGTTPLDADAPPTVYEDEHLLIVDKPCGMLSVPGRGAHLADSVLTRLQTRYPHATGPLLVHRLDLDTSGVLLAAKDAATFAALQRLFAQRQIVKQYVAWLDGAVPHDHGTIALPLRVDVDDRPRHIHDPEWGKSASTSWHVLERRDGRTRVALEPHTGRTHQLRVHASHPDGLDAPIIGDRLYGREPPADTQRLLLHAESIRFRHPTTGATLQVTRPAPF